MRSKHDATIRIEEWSILCHIRCTMQNRIAQSRLAITQMIKVKQSCHHHEVGCIDFDGYFSIKVFTAFSRRKIIQSML